MSSPSRSMLIAALLIAGVASQACGQPAQPAAVVTIKNFDYSPMTVTIPAGASVTWRNLDEEPHTVTSLDGLFRSPGLDTGDTFTFRFTQAGTYRYVCSIHPQMRASIVVR